jgi:hypothetical protein
VEDKEKTRDTETAGKGGTAYEARGRVFESPRAYQRIDNAWLILHLGLAQIYFVFL